ncbi:tetratricopeptide repeat protein [Flavobacteriaceae bacterium TP-CH-4]|uniref:Tetratricopeptide repeat protein n=1 Tax=Pelagihabitans pacificus TaxID=2696054 RepID=A0A967ECL8_9FLAO|nr:tetratricopeptide repeat protein [Pelagihabitans pacificus]NHF61336.1 tetratricopeptide repeat protein [Pelagihabitans pacificus]
MKSKIICWFLVVCALSPPLCGQDYKNLDSLLNAYNKRSTDTIKVNIADRILQNLTYTDPERAYKFAHEMVKMSKQLDYKDGVARGLNQISSYFFNRDELDSAYYYTKATYDMVTESQNIGGILTSNTRFANLYDRQNDFETAKQYLAANLEIYANKDTISYAREIDFKFIGSTYYMLSEIDLKQGRYNLALQNGLKALREYKDRAKNQLFVADAHVLLGQIEIKLENYKSSIGHFEKAYKVYNEFEDLLWQSDALRFIGENLMYLNKPEEAIKYLQKAIDISRENKFQLKEASAYNLLGNAYTNLGKFPEAINSLKKSLEVYSKMDNPTEIHKTYTSLGLLYNQMNQPDQAITYLEESIRISDSLKALPQTRSAYFERSKALRKKREYKSALDDYIKFAQLNDSLFNVRKSQQIEEMRAMFDIETKEQQIALQEKEITVLEQKASISNLQKLLLGIGLLLSLIGFYAVRQKIKRNKLEKEKVDAELAFKKKELTTHALNLARKNETLENLKLKAQELKDKESSVAGYNQLIHSINFDLQDDNNWQNFSRYFEEVHKDFNSNVKTKYPDVTSNELRLLALLKMNLSSKEIANILNISAEGIKKARYRLRKKLDLTTEDSLQDLVLSL